MRKKIILSCLGFVIAGLGCLFETIDVNAAPGDCKTATILGKTTNTCNWTAQNYYNTSGSTPELRAGRNAIKDVQEAAKGMEDNSNVPNWCATWLGTTAAEGATYEVSSLNGTINISFYGMCTLKEDETSVFVVQDAENQNTNIVTGADNFKRGTWGTPTHTEAQLHVSRFINGINYSVEGDYLVYRRKLYFYRCHGPTNLNSCGKLEPEITLKVRRNLVLTVVGKNIYDNSDIVEGNKKVEGIISGNSVSAERNYLWDDVTRRKFIGWKETSQSGLSGIVSNNTDNKTYAFEADGTYNMNKTIYKKINNTGFTASKTVYAYYAVGCRLNVESDVGAKISIERTDSDYSSYFKSDWPGGTAYALYKGDKLKISFGVDSGYSLTSHTVNGANFESGGTITVGGSGGTCNDVTIKAESNAPAEIEGKTEAKALQANTHTNAQTTGWQRNGFTEASTLWLDNGSNDGQNFVVNLGCTYGCKVNFRHALRRLSGSGNVSYTIERIYDSKNKETVKSGTENVISGNEKEVESSEVTLYPGDTVCEELSINGGAIRTKACAIATGKLQPEWDENMLTGIEVKNSDGKAIYKEKYQEYVYAKPGDQIDFRVTYNPVVQSAYNMIIPRISIDGSPIYYNDENKTLIEIFNEDKKPDGAEWRSGYTIYSNNWSNNSESFFSEEIGSTKRVVRTDGIGRKVLAADVGRGNMFTLVEVNRESQPQRTPNQVTFKDNNGVLLAEVSTFFSTYAATVAVPYNFRNRIEINGTDSIVYAGESSNINAIVTVGGKENLVTTDGGEYATVARDIKVKFIRIDKSREKKGIGSYGSKDADLCGYYGLSDGSAACSVGNENGTDELGANSVTTFKLLEHLPDMKAGAELCYAAAVYPANSGVDYNMDRKGSDSWAISDTICVKVAKRPSFQVWGGSLYSAGAVRTPASVKVNLSNDSTINEDNRAVFGSWVEQSVVGNGIINGLASGAATAGVGGSRESGNTGYCDVRVPLSLANYSSRAILNGLCPSGTTGTTGKSGIKITRDYDTTVKQIAGGKTIETYDGNYEISGGDFTNISGTRIIKNNGNIIIKSNVTYSDAAISSLENVPKLVLYTTGDITIDCGVGRVDAILIAKGEVNTCNNSDINSQENSNQLIINGMIIANNLVLNRTYGAGTGAASGIPAEIVNYDTSTIVWGGMKAEIEGGSELTSVYQHELAPRY